MNPRKIRRLTEAIKAKNFTVAEEAFAAIMQRKVQNALVNERKNLQPLSESYDEKTVRHQCNGCGDLWYGPPSEQECPKCGKRQFEESLDGPRCTSKHKGGAQCVLDAGHSGKHQAAAGESHYIWEASNCPGCGKPLGPVDAMMGYCRKCADKGHKEVTGKR